MALKSSNRLIVEGYDDLHSVAALMGSHIEWEEDKYKAPVWIEISNGVEDILKDGFLSAKIKDPQVKSLGIMLDADAKPDERYSRIASLCNSLFEFPTAIPVEGLVLQNSDQKRLGVWIMPDNRSEGNIETFLKELVPSLSEPSWLHAVESVRTAKGMGCPCHDSHLTKANLFTWLAWQDPPGQSPGRALTKRFLDPHCAAAANFVTWFRTLYQL